MSDGYSVYKNRGKWYARVKYPQAHPGYKPPHGWTSHPTSADTRQRALAEAEAMHGRVQRGLPVTDVRAGILVRDLVADHLERYQRRRIKDRDRWRALAEGDLRVYVLPYLGDRVAAELRGADVRAWLAELQLRYAPRTCNLALARLGALYAWAIDQAELLECRNPARGIEALPTERADFFYEADQVEAFLRLDWRSMPVGLQERWFMAATALYAGPRHGELRGLPWSKLHLAEGWVLIDEQWEGRPTKGAPRALPIHRELLPLLQAWRQIAADSPKIGIGRLVFPRPDGSGENVVEGSSVDNTPLRGLLTLAGLPLPPPGRSQRIWHVLRHTFATHTDRVAGPLVVGRALGHAPPGAQVTQTYLHRAPDRRAAEELRADFDRLTYGAARRGGTRVG